MRLHQWRKEPSNDTAISSGGLLRAALTVLATLSLFVGILYVQMTFFWTPLQSHYFGDYFGPSSQGTSEMLLLVIDYGNTSGIATDADVVMDRADHFLLSDKARQGGARNLKWVSKEGTGTELHTLLQNRIYEGRSTWQIIRFAVVCPFALVTGFFVWSRGRRRLSERELKTGRGLQGPRIVTREEFNRLKSSDGIGFRTNERPGLREAMLGRSDHYVRIPRREESHHTLIMGDTGSGKSSLIRQLLLQIADRGESAIVYDPALEYTPQFFRPGTDQILNPLDLRMPYWTPGDEVHHVAETLTLAKSLFPDNHTDSRFFVESARKVFAYLLRYRPNPQQLSAWMKDPTEIDRRLQGTELAALLDARAPGQRSGVLASLNLVADAFELLPAESEAHGCWSAAAWSAHRKGWLFLPGTHEVRERLLPIISMWLDSLILRLISQTDGTRPPVWIILDELASLQKLPQLATALAEGRKANVRLLLGFQGRSQLEARYGPEAETMLSQPMTKIFLRTSEPRAAEWISKAIGEVEVEHLRTSHTRQRGMFGLRDRSRDTHTTHIEQKTEPLVMASAIGGLQDLSGFIKSQNLVVSATFPYIPAEQRAVSFVPRPINGLDLFVSPEITDLKTDNRHGTSGSQMLSQRR